MPNVPPLRFPEFTGEWEKQNFADNLLRLENGVNYDTNETEGLPLSRIETISTSSINYEKVGHCNTKNIDHYKMEYGDILFSHINSMSHIGKTAYYYAERPLYHGMNLLLIRCNSRLNSLFFYHLLNTPHFLRTCQVYAKQAVNQASISTSDIKKIQIHVPTIQEQNKIASFISLLGQRIETQIRVIEDLQTLKKAISTKVFTEIKGCNSEKLGTLCSITTGKLDANAMTDEGEYMFFTCSRENYKTDTFAFDGEALLIAGNGEIGSVKYYNGKFNAYQRTYILQNFSENIKYLQYYIEHHLPQRVLKEKNVGAMPYIVLSTLADMPILLPSENKQNNIAKALQVIENKIYVEYSVLDQYKQQKQYLLQKMFI